MSLSMLKNGVPWAGLALGPAAWALNTQVTYPLPSWVCAQDVNPLPLIAAGFALLALAGGLLSLRAWRRLGPGHSPHRFLAGIGAGFALLLTLVVLLQGIASLIFSGCER